MELTVFLVGISLAFLLFLLIRWFLERYEIDDLENKAVFITGCDSGFGKALAIRCAERAMPVFAGCMFEKSITEYKVLSRNYRTPIDAFILDVTNDGSVDNAKKYVENRTQKYGAQVRDMLSFFLSAVHDTILGLHGVVNNAGVLGHTFFDDFLTVDDYKNVAEVNTWGVIRVTHAMKPLVKRTRSELRMFGVSLHVLEPGFFNTTLTSAENVEKQLNTLYARCAEEAKNEYGKEFFFEMRQKTLWLLGLISSNKIDYVTDAYFHALTAVYPRSRYQVGWDSILVYIPLSFLPTPVFEFLMRIMEWMMRIPTPNALKKTKQF
ncbi:oxidoreductase, short chain dehydrogenase/reductase family protein [Ancylostoma duodenale]|uniref:Oxidoreductase, short chain dehydrogenase/reductase family protein n=1 Tax=Ancylostoma duodenale TaxID=51022 RepID=A0A0C2GGH0_9BILA|nr:oxidoreductase, short chain dehydrogenase/reductase family protein [Ancylostoma duodenale]